MTDRPPYHPLHEYTVDSDLVQPLTVDPDLRRQLAVDLELPANAFPKPLTVDDFRWRCAKCDKTWPYDPRSPGGPAGADHGPAHR